MLTRRSFVAALLAVAVAPPVAFAQADSLSVRRAPAMHLRGTLISVGSPAEDWLRVQQLLGNRPLHGLFLRSPSSLTPQLAAARPGIHASIVQPDLHLVRNSGMAFSMNDGALWAGRGANGLVRGGAQVEWGRVTLNAVPEVLYSENLAYPLVDPAVYPPPPTGRSPFAAPWFVNIPSIDLPTRMGDRRILRLTPGQSALAIKAGAVEVGVATENEWWGPGIRNALILSNNAPGFPRIFLRTATPITTRIGAFEARWLVGGLTESPYFDQSSHNDLRSISMLGLTWQPRWEPGLIFGAARAVFAPTRSWGSVLGDFWQVFADVGQPNARSYVDQTPSTGRDQLFCLFFRWAFPGYGFETYAELARAEQPTSLRDLLVEPNHSQGYTVGLQWVGLPIARRGRMRVAAEASYLEMSTTARYRPQGTWYTSRPVIQGYTEQGQTLGAAIGPGSSSQYLGIGYMESRWQTGIFFERIRWQNDVHSQRIDYDTGVPVTWCEHDVTVRWGFRAAGGNRFGTVSASYATGTRMNPFFVRAPSCMFGNVKDVRVKTLSVTLSPGVLRY